MKGLRGNFESISFGKAYKAFAYLKKLNEYTKN